MFWDGFAAPSSSWPWLFTPKEAARGTSSKSGHPFCRLPCCKIKDPSSASEQLRSSEWAVCGSSRAVGRLSPRGEALFSPTALSRSGKEGASLEGLAGGKSAASDKEDSSGGLRCLGTGEADESLQSLSGSSSRRSGSFGRLGLAGSRGRQLLLPTGRS